MDPSIVIRSVGPSDAPALTAFYAALSAATRHDRFFSFACPSPLAITTWCAARPVAAGLVALTDDRIVGHLLGEPAPGGGIEIAVAVADGYRRRGIGGALVRVLDAWLTTHHVGRVTATTMIGNAHMIRLFSLLGTVHSRYVGASELDMEITRPI